METVTPSLTCGSSSPSIASRICAASGSSPAPFFRRRWRAWAREDRRAADSAVGVP